MFVDVLCVIHVCPWVSPVADHDRHVCVCCRAELDSVREKYFRASIVVKELCFSGCVLVRLYFSPDVEPRWTRRKTMVAIVLT